MVKPTGAKAAQAQAIVDKAIAKQAEAEAEAEAISPVMEAEMEAEAEAVEAEMEAVEAEAVSPIRVTSVGYGKTEDHKNRQADGSVWAEVEGRSGFLPLVGSGERFYIDFSARDVGMELADFVQFLAQKQTELFVSENPGEVARAENGRLHLANEKASLKAVLESVAQKAIAEHLGLALTERTSKAKVGVSYKVE